MKFDYKRLKGERVARGFTVQQIADFLGIAKSTYSKKENGKLPITVDEFGNLAKKLGIPENEVQIFFTLNVA